LNVPQVQFLRVGIFGQRQRQRRVQPAASESLRGRDVAGT
jgi:hypothetical protein